MINKLLQISLFFIIVTSVNAQNIRNDLRTFASEIENLKYTTEKFDQHEDFISLRFDFLVRRTNISSLFLDDSSVKILLISGDQIVITPETKLISHVEVYESLKWILMTGKHKYKSATLEHQSKARTLVKRASEDQLPRQLGTAQSVWSSINSWSSIASNCKFELTNKKSSIKLKEQH